MATSLDIDLETARKHIDKLKEEIIKEQKRNEQLLNEIDNYEKLIGILISAGYMTCETVNAAQSLIVSKDNE